MNYSMVSRALQELGWDWNHPRIHAYINDMKWIHDKDYTPQTLPNKHYARLIMFLEAYQRIEHNLAINSLGWDSPFIVDFFERHSVLDEQGESTNRLRLKDWIRLEELVAENDCPF